MRYNILSILLVTIFILSMVSATSPTETYLPQPVKQGTCATLSQSCSNCSYVNITTLTYPNGTISYLNSVMTKNDIDYNYTFCDTEQLDWYIYNTKGNPDGITSTQPISIIVTATGSDMNISKAISYFLIFIFSFILFVGLLLMGIALPNKNKSDEMTGYVLQVNNLKYFKLLCLGLAYLTATFITYFSWMICYAYLDMEFLTTILRFVFTALAVLILPLFILFTYLTITNAIRDANIVRMLERGFTVRENGKT